MTAGTAGPGTAVAWRSVSRVHDGRRGSAAVTALADLTLDAHPGELLVLVGPSGSGKSTALRVLAGIEPVQGGTVAIGGTDVTTVPAHRRDVAMVFQDLALFPHLDVTGNILFGPTVRDMPAEEQRARLDTVSRQLGIEELLARRPTELSGGQRQRVALARAMVREPAVFLLDEPLSNLDARLRVDARAEIVALQQRLGTTMVFVTHDQAEAMTMGHRIAVLRDGRLEQVGTPREIYDAPATLFVATFLGAPPMSILPGDTPLARVGPDRTVGVRAEDLRVHADDGTDGLPAQVMTRHDLGSEIVLHLDTAVGDIAVRLPTDDATPQGAQVRLTVADPGRLHVFDASTGLRVSDG